MNLPLWKSKKLTERFVIPVDKEMKQSIEWLKASKNVNTAEWARQILRRELELLKETT